MVQEYIFPLPSSIQGLNAHNTPHISLLWVRERITHFDLKDALWNLYIVHSPTNALFIKLGKV